MDTVDFEEFHTQHLPALLADGQGVAAGWYLDEDQTLALRLSTGPAFTYRSTGDNMEIRPGDDATTVVELAPDGFADLVSETWSVFGLLYGDRVTTPRGAFADFARWEAPLQALWFGRPIYGADTIASLVDADGNALDLGRSFTLEGAEAEDAATFLSATGFVILRRVFAASEIDDLNAIVAEEKSRAAPGDGMSWWATRSDGREVCCRLTYMARRSDRVASLAEDDRLARIAALADDQLLPCLDRLDGVSVVIKNPAVITGLSDLPWHRDCGMGGHRILCPGLNVGVQLDHADAANGQLLYLAGSHHHAAQQLTDLDGLPVIAVETEPGDVTVHFGHTLHAAPPPTSATAGRKALYFGYHVPEAFKVIGPGQSYNDVLVQRDAGRVKSVDEVVGG